MLLQSTDTPSHPLIIDTQKHIRIYGENEKYTIHLSKIAIQILMLLFH